MYQVKEKVISGIECNLQIKWVLVLLPQSKINFCIVTYKINKNKECFK